MFFFIDAARHKRLTQQSERDCLYKHVDGDRQFVKHVNHTRHDHSYADLSGNITYNMTDTTGITYYLHSSVLGGKTIAELDQNGVKTKGYVYAGGARVATQTVTGSSNWVQLEATNPVTGAAITTDANGTYAARQEPDPLGRELATAPDPTVAVDPLASSKWNDPMPIEYTGGPSQDAIDAMAAWGTEMDAMYDRGLAEYYWSKGKRDAVLQILARNPNVGFVYNRVGFGKPSVSGSVFGLEAANVLSALSTLIDDGTFVQTGGPGFSAYADERRFAHVQQNPITVLGPAGAPPNTGEVVAQMNVVTEQQVNDINGANCVGKTCDCVPLVKKLTDTAEVHTSRWRSGEQALGNAHLGYGVAIATFFDGRYPSRPTGNHAAILLGQVAPSRLYPLGGILVLDQFPNRGRVGIRVIQNRQGQGYPSDDASRFSVIWYVGPPRR